MRDDIEDWKIIYPLNVLKQYDSCSCGVCVIENANIFLESIDEEQNFNESLQHRVFDKENIDDIRQELITEINEQTSDQRKYCIICRESNTGPKGKATEKCGICLRALHNLCYLSGSKEQKTNIVCWGCQMFQQFGNN